MADRTSTSYRYTLVFFICLALVLAWLIVPRVLPVWAWLNIKPENIAQSQHIPVGGFEQDYTGTVVYNPRGEGDPIPWQIVFCEPVYETDEIYEEQILVRAHVINGGTGKPPSTMDLGSVQADRFYEVTFRRYPPGSFGIGSTRPVLVYRPMGMSKRAIGVGKGLLSLLEEYDRDEDIWPERDDGWRPAEDVAEDFE